MIINKTYLRSLKLISHYLPEGILIIIFCIIQLKHLNIDFWNDELYTLKHFTFVPLSKTVIDYHVPNNHIFFNLINNLYLKLLGEQSLHSLMDTPYKLRIIPMISSFLTVLFTYFIAVKFLNRFIGRLASCILITTIPFFNFALQIRGYQMSSLFLVLLVYFCLSYFKSPKYVYLWFIALTSALVIYTIPSNIYPVISILITYFIFLFLSISNKIKSAGQYETQHILENQSLHVVISLSLGVLFSLLLYAPIFKEVFMNDYVKSGPSFVFSRLGYYGFHISNGMISGRWILFVICVLGFLLTIKKLKNWKMLSLFLAICIIPIIIVFIRGDNAPLRVFVVSAPFFALLGGYGVHQCWRHFFKSKYLLDLSFYFVILMYSLFTFNLQLKNISCHLLTDIKEERRSQDLYYQYYSSHYQPLKDADKLKKLLKKKSIPVVIQGCEPHGIPNYLDKFDILYYHNYHRENGLDSILNISDSIYIITNHPYSLDNIESHKLTLLSETLTYHNIVLLERGNLVH